MPHPEICLMKFVIKVYVVATRYPKPRELTPALEVRQEAIQGFESGVRLTSAGQTLQSGQRTP
jgi:hypothetical protein